MPTALRAALPMLALAAMSLGALAATPRTMYASPRGHAHGHTPQSHQAVPVTCSFKFIIGRQTCYGPADATAVTAGIPWALDPSVAVKNTLGLDLTQISVLSQPSSGTSRSLHPVQIDYMYGPLGLDYGRVGASPRVARVIENPGRAPLATRMAPGIPLPITRRVCGTTVQISPAADPERAHPAYGPWYLIGAFPHGNHSVGIVANTDQQTLTTLACTILRAG